MKSVAAVCALVCLACSAAHAHQDHILTATSDGSISAIPKEFGPVRVVVSALGTKAPVVGFSVKDKSTSLPPCATRLIRTKSLTDVEIAGSWYHDESTLPSYINVTFFDPGRSRNEDMSSRYEFLFNLRTSRLIHVKRFEANKQRNGGQYSEPLLSGCLS